MAVVPFASKLQSELREDAREFVDDRFYALIEGLSGGPIEATVFNTYGDATLRANRVLGFIQYVTTLDERLTALEQN